MPEADRAGALAAAPRAGDAARRGGILLLVLTAAGWGANWPILKQLLTELPPLAARGWAGVVAAAALALVARLRGIPLAVPRVLWGRLVLASFLNVTAWMGFTTLALWWIEAGQGAMLAYTMPLWAVLMSWALLGARPEPAQWLGLALGLAGAGLAIGSLELALGPERLPGIGFALAAALLFALGTISTKRWPLPLAPVAATAWQVGLGCLPLLPLSFILEDADFSRLSSGGWLAFLYMTAGSLCLCYLAWFEALKRIPPAQAAIATLLAPAIGVGSAGLWLGEPLGARELLALALTLAGIACATGLWQRPAP